MSSCKSVPAINVIQDQSETRQKSKCATNGKISHIRLFESDDWLFYRVITVIITRFEQK